MAGQATSQGVAERAARLRAERHAEHRAPESLALVTFRLGNESYAVPADHARGIIARQAIVPIPSTPPHVLGVTSFRGEILPVFDLKVMLGLSQQPATPEYFVIARPGADSAALGCDSCPDIVQVLADDIKPPRSTMASPTAHYLQGHVVVRGGLIGVLDVNKVLQC
ncbi:MAG: purine-binding chemotaxis protein CheW [Armatimonadota bacterium]|nr:MAG: purine-binding chemotaxis protein CheW [Armatimonadota bacterium]